ncbi:site-specific integrase [Clostridiales Family XIII bacterium ASD5510]|uniref:Site-specific integrase n=1 Tax=Hominibacterium faecale TaxID=2839743 RepID=A0A9J6QYC9_9FIRM|nr:site-specific integrase [Hominibacterium faecale]MCU7380464.1 site-specific integrase [Hominibacterium faecale]
MPRTTFTYEGERHDISAKTEAELAAKVAIRKKELEEGTRLKKNMPFNLCANAWLERKRSYLKKEKTVKDYKKFVNHLNDHFGSKRIKKITATDCEDCLRNYADLGMSKAFVDKMTTIMNQIFKYAITSKTLLVNPMVDVKKPVAEEGTHRQLSDQEREVILAVAEYHHAGLWIETMLYCGLRPGETPTVQGRDIDIKEEILHIRGTKNNNADRYVPIPRHFIKELAGFKKAEYIFTTEHGTKLTEQSMKRWWKSFKNEMDRVIGAEIYRNKIIESKLPSLKDDPDDSSLTLYCLRHTYCTDLELKGVPINIAKELMGHASVETTAKYYTHFTKTTMLLAKQLINGDAGNQKCLSCPSLKKCGPLCHVGVNVGRPSETLKNSGTTPHS